MENRSTKTPKPIHFQLLDFKGYSRYLIPSAGKIIEKALPVQEGYTVVEANYVRIDFPGRNMEPTIPAFSVMKGLPIPLDDIKTLTEGVYSCLVADDLMSQVIQIHTGRLKGSPTTDSLVLWPDSAGFKKITIPIKQIAFLFRIKEYELQNVNDPQV